MGKTGSQTARKHNCTDLQAAGVDASPYASAATEHAMFSASLRTRTTVFLRMLY